MLRKDFLVRQIEDFGKAMALILGYKKIKDFEKYEKEMADTFNKFTALQLISVENMSLQDFENSILKVDELIPDQKKILGDLLYEKMMYYHEFFPSHNISMLKQKCILLYKNYQDSLTQNEFNLDVHYKLEILNQ